MLKMIASDLDGTLLNFIARTDRYILNTIDRVLDQGLYFVVATGRSMQGEKTGLNFGNRPLYIISNNGAVIQNPQNKVLFKKEIPKSFIIKTLETFPNQSFDFIGVDETWVNTSQEQYLKGFDGDRSPIRGAALKIIHKHMRNHHFETSMAEILSQEIIKINTRIPDPEGLATFNRYLAESPEVINLPFGDGIFELTKQSVNKGFSLQWLCDELKINKKEVAVFGDGGNDLELLEQFPNSYAPKNAKPEAKLRAKSIIGPNTTYSVPRKIRQLLKEQNR